MFFVFVLFAVPFFAVIQPVHLASLVPFASHFFTCVHHAVLPFAALPAISHCALLTSPSRGAYYYFILLFFSRSRMSIIIMKLFHILLRGQRRTQKLEENRNWREQLFLNIYIHLLRTYSCVSSFWWVVWSLCVCGPRLCRRAVLALLCLCFRPSGLAQISDYRPPTPPPYFALVGGESLRDGKVWALTFVLPHGFGGGRGEEEREGLGSLSRREEKLLRRR